MSIDKISTKEVNRPFRQESEKALQQKVNEIIDEINGGLTATEIEVESGTAAAPSLGFSTDPDTGFYRSAANQVGVSTGGTGQVIFADGSIQPVTDNDVDLGTTTKEFKDLFIDGTANIDALVADTADINAGTIDGTIIGGSSAAAITGTTIGGTVITASTAVAIPDGAVGTLGLRIGADGNNGLYGISDTQIGVAVEGALIAGFNTAGIFTGSITEQITGVGIQLAKATIQQRTGTAKNTTGTASAAELAGGLITSTSAAAVALTLPTATDLGTQLSAVQGTTFDFIVDNIAGANTVTVTVAAGITAVTAVVTGSDTLTVGSGVAGMFRLYFTSATVAKLSRIF